MAITSFKFSEAFPFATFAFGIGGETWIIVQQNYLPNNISHFFNS
jgi:hypothetical protein